MAKRLTPERPTTVSVTRHLELIMSAGNIPAYSLTLSKKALSGASCR
jgi:hypothetical protein